jgi:hypothetical protein
MTLNCGKVKQASIHLDLDTYHRHLLGKVLRREDSSRTEPFPFNVFREVCSWDNVFCEVVECPTLSAFLLSLRPPPLFAPAAPSRKRERE